MAKTCSICKETKSFDFFAERKSMKDGHQSECKVCQSARTTRYRKANPEKVAESQKKYREKNKDKLDAYIKEYRSNNDEIVKNACFRYHWVNRDSLLEKKKEYYQNNKDKSYEANRNRRALARGAEGKHFIADIRSILENQNGRCKVCFVDVREGYHVDHIVPLIKGGSNWPNNLQILCPSCNTSKGARDYDEWMQNRKIEEI